MQLLLEVQSLVEVSLLRWVWLRQLVLQSVLGLLDGLQEGLFDLQVPVK